MQDRVQFRPQSGKTVVPLLALAALVAAALGVWLGTWFSQPQQPPQLDGGTLLPSAKSIETFELVDHNRQPFTPERLRGKWTFAFFGYTHCPDVCPNTLTLLNVVARKLDQRQPAPRDVQFVFFSVDPDRDKPEQLADYVAYFNEAFIGVTGTNAQIKALTRQLGILYARADGPDGSDENYLIDHSASILLFNKAGRLAAIFSQVPHDPGGIVRDLQRVRDYYR